MRLVTGWRELDVGAARAGDREPVLDKQEIELSKCKEESRVDRELSEETGKEGGEREFVLWLILQLLINQDGIFLLLNIFLLP